LIERNVHGFEVSDVSASASCGPVDDARWRFQRGVVVPMPTRCAPAEKIASVSVVDVAHLLAALPLPVPHALAFAETVPFADTWRQRVPVPPVLEMTRAEVDAVPVTVMLVVVAPSESTAKSVVDAAFAISKILPLVLPQIVVDA
jgi:hypothetical protein